MKSGTCQVNKGVVKVVKSCSASLLRGKDPVSLRAGRLVGQPLAWAHLRKAFYCVARMQASDWLACRVCTL